MCDFTETAPLWEYRFCPTAEEYYRALTAGELRKASKTRLVIQSVILGAVALWCILPLFFGGKGDVMLAGVAAAVCAAMWLVPPLKMKADAKNAAAAEVAVQLRVYEQGLCFSAGEDAAVVAFSEITCHPSPEQLTLSVGEALVPVPRRAVAEDCYRFLCDRFSQSN